MCVHVCRIGIEAPAFANERLAPCAQLCANNVPQFPLLPGLQRFSCNENLLCQVELFLLATRAITQHPLSVAPLNQQHS